MRYQTTIREAQYFLFDYIERYYNRKRMHSALDDLSPVEFRKNYCITRSVFLGELYSAYNRKHLLHYRRIYYKLFLRTIYRSR
ncbi:MULTISPECIES: IS3 family transposase [Leptospira]|uniref:IS3 family transposase n=1 Tax=Leptospira TaxID=171 RepID=UPI0013BE9DD1